MFDKVLAIIQTVQLPHIILVIFLVLLPLYRKEIRSFMGRLAKSDIGPGLQIRTPPAQIDTSEPSSSGKPAPLIQSEISHPAVARRAEELRAQLDELNLQDAESREKQLLRDVAVNEIMRHFEIVYRTIFSSQLYALRRMNEALYGVPPSELQEIFEDARTRNQNQFAAWHYNYDGWLAFLTQSGFVVLEGTQAKITDYGRLFLTYLVQSGYGQHGLFQTF